METNKSKTIEAFWNDETDDDGENVSGYAWTCPSCGDYNSIGDDFTWSGKLGSYVMPDKCECEHCDSKESFTITKRP